MRVLIGTPIHEVKDYSMSRWLENVANLTNLTPADVLMVDNSPGLFYTEKVKDYCKKFSLKNFRIEHFEINNPNLNTEQARSIKVEVSQEIIRREALRGNYDLWFSWECDQLIPTNALNELIRLMKSGPYMMVVHNSWSRTNNQDFNANMGCTLISKKALEIGWFLPDKNGEISLDPNDSYNVDETMFKKRILKSEGSYIEVYGVIKPIFHLNR